MTAPVQLVDHAMQIAESAERPDLRARLVQTRRRLLDPTVRVLVVGEFKQGKSQLVNALVGAPICPVDDDVATAVPTVVSHADEPTASLMWTAGGAPAPTDDGDPPTERTPVRLEDLAGHVTERSDAGSHRRLVAAEVGVPRSVLAGGLVIVDTPGVGGLGSTHAARTMAALPTADAVLLVSDAAQEYTEPEMEFLRRAVKLCPNVGCVLTKTDLYPHWRRVVELDRQHLADAGVDAELLPVSSTLRLHAVRERDDELNTESGFRTLVRYLRQDVLGQAALLSRRNVANDVLVTTEHLATSLRTELAALEDPVRSGAMISELETARDGADELRRRTSRWQTVLSDGVADLTADIDYDLRDRARALGREAEEAIDAADPGQVWDQFTDWLEQQTAALVSDNFLWASERSDYLAEQVAETFAETAGSSVPALRIADAEGVLDPVSELEDLDRGHLSLHQKVLIGMRGSYGGVLMFGLLTGIAGMALLNPISVGAGLLLGGKAYRDDKATRLKRRQAEAKQAVRRHLDDVVFQVSKESKDRLRHVQRVLRDHFQEVATELHRSLAESVRAAQKAANTDSSQRERRIRELKRELDRIRSLQITARALETGRRQEARSA